jgi:cytochrome c biogenesis protein
MTGSQKQGSDSSGFRFILSEIASFFTSVKTTLGLLFLLASASVLGTVIPQDLSPEQLQQTAAGLSHRLMVILDLHSLYRSWWFILLLTLLALNLLGCLLKRLPAIPAEWKHDYRKNSFSFSITDSRPEPELTEILSLAMGSLMRVSPRTVSTERGQALLWVRDRMQLLGFPLMHAAILLILLGGLMGLFYGVKGHIQIKEGDSANRFRVVPSGEARVLPFTISVDKFTLTRYPGGEPKEFRSDVRLFVNDAEAFKGSILVNHPVTLHGISLYQSDYRLTGVKEVRLTAIRKDGNESELVVRPHEETTLPGTPYRLHLLSVDPGTTKRGPGVELKAESVGQESKTIRVYKNATDLAQLGDTRMRFDDYSPLYATGLQVGYDPGTPIVWTGCLSLVLGFLLTLFTNHRGVLVEFRRTGQGTSVRISGRSKRLRREFRETVERTTRESLNKPDKR